MTPHRPITVLFDIDGTLITTGGAALTAKAIERAGDLVGEPIGRRRVLVVGDTPLDIRAAKGAGAISVGVATGHYSVDELRSAGADYARSSLQEDLPL
jgi:phosphoglycolate phosphatase